MSVRILVEFNTQPGKADEMASLLEEKVYPLLTGADGFHGIKMFRDPEDAEHIIELEEWESSEKFQAWLEPVLADFGPVLQPMLAAPPRMVTLNEVASA